MADTQGGEVGNRNIRAVAGRPQRRVDRRADVNVGHVWLVVVSNDERLVFTRELIAYGGGVQSANGEFNREAANDRQKGPDRSSEQVGKTAAAPRMKPPRELDRAGAAGAHKERMAKDQLASQLSPRQLAVYEAAQHRMEAESGRASPSQGLGR